MDEENKVELETLNQDEGVVLDETTDEDSQDDSSNQPTDDKDYQKLYENQKARAKKAEEALKALKGSGTKPPVKAPLQTNNPTHPVDVDERVLKANGMNDELLTKLKAIAKVEGIGLIEAQSNDLFVAYKEKLEREEKAKKASLGASRGSGKTETKKSFSSSNLPEDEHKALWRERMGK